MAEIDLVPADYRVRIQHRQITKRFATSFVILLLCIAGGRLWLGTMIIKERNFISKLKNGEVAVLEQRKLFEDLKTQRSALISRLQALKELRGGPPADRMFPLIDRAIDSSVWFLDLTYIRSDAVQQTKAADQPAAYIQITSKRDASSSKESWRDSTHMEIKGEAVSHSAVAGFVSRLLQQPEIKDVHVLNTGSRRYAAGQVVEFSLAVVIDSNGGES